MDTPTASPASMTLWYREPADGWLQSLPVGSARLGGLVFGGVPTERIALNEESLWAGGPRDTNRPEAREALPEVRRLLAEGKFAEAEELAVEKLRGSPHRLKPYVPLGDLEIELEGHQKVDDYERDLNLRTGIAVTRYRAGEATVTREVFASATDQVLVVGVRADRPESISLRASMSRYEGARLRTHGEDGAVLEGKVPDGGLEFEAHLKVVADGGRVRAGERGVTVAGANAVTLIVAAATPMSCEAPAAECESRVLAAAEKSFAALRAAHVADHQSLFDRFSLRLGPADAEPDPRPIDERLAAVRKGGEDLDLLARYVQYGRYLLIASARPGSLPPNLQGVWNPLPEPPWNSDYHLNINLQMNHWPAEVTGLPECHRPLIDFMHDLREHGAETARVHYGCDGFVVHHITDVWGFTTPGDGACGIWPTGAAWLCRHLWDHWLWTRDRRDLELSYPILAECSRFFLDFLVEDPEGEHLVTSPSYSPENRFLTGEGDATAGLCMGPAMDHQLLRDLFTATIAAAEALDVDEDLRDRLAATRDRLPPDRVGSDGRLLEWRTEREEAEPGHRHVSHLYALYPSEQITLRRTPELAAAVRRSLEHRLENGGGGTGWSRAWVAALWARLGEGDLAYESLLVLLRESTEANLFDLHPPHRFQIDGNFGATAAAVEMLVQSHDGAIHLLPALPGAWPEGDVRGVRARGGHVVGVAWEDGALAEATIQAAGGETIRVRTEEAVDVTRDGESVDVERVADDVVAFAANAAEVYTIRPAAT